MASTRIRRHVARVVAVAAIAGGLGIVAPSAHANEMTIGGGDPCNTSVTVWWNVPPDPGQRPAGFSFYWTCLTVAGPDPWQHLPAVQIDPPPVTLTLPIEP